MRGWGDAGGFADEPNPRPASCHPGAGRLYARLALIRAGLSLRGSSRPPYPRRKRCAYVRFVCGRTCVSSEGAATGARVNLVNGGRGVKAAVPSARRSVGQRQEAGQFSRYNVETAHRIRTDAAAGVPRLRRSGDGQLHRLERRLRFWWIRRGCQCHLRSQARCSRRHFRCRRRGVRRGT